MSAHNKTSGNEPESERLRQSLAFLHQAREVRDLEPAQIQRIARRLKGKTARPRRMVLVPVAVTLGIVLVAGAAFAVAKGGLRSLPVVGPLFAPTAATGDPKPGTKHKPATRPSIDKTPATEISAPTPAPAAGQPSPVPTVLPAPSPEVTILHPPRPAQRGEGRGEGPRHTLALRDPDHSHQASRTSEAPVVPVPPAAEREENPIVAESRSFASVIEPWHRTRNASATLALLDAHERRYPSGHRRLESRVLRAEIFLSQGRESEALGVLDSVSLAGIPRGRELQTVRGELRIKAGRCPEGKRDLGEVLEKNMADALAKRASQAMSHCP